MIDAITGLDHVVVNVREQMDRTVAQYRRLGFQATPRGYHSLGTINHLMVFQHDYLELLGYPPGQPPAGLGAMVAAEPGLVACALASEDATAVHRQAREVAIPVDEPLSFSRPVALPEGEREAAFRITRFDPDHTPGAALFVCEHHTRELVWRPEWQHHPNGVSDIAFISVVVPDPAAAIAPYVQLLGGEPMPATGGLNLNMGRVRLELLSAAALAERAPGLGRAAAPPAYPAMLGLRVVDLAATAAHLRAQGVVFRESTGQLQVGAADAGGVILAFVA